jgi:hypothetical protein
LKTLQPRRKKYRRNNHVYSGNGFTINKAQTLAAVAAETTAIRDRSAGLHRKARNAKVINVTICFARYRIPGFLRRAANIGTVGGQ